MARVFSAIDIENEKALQRLEHIQEKLDLGFRKTPPEKMHITLEFFRDVDEHEIQELKKAIQNIDHRPFTATAKDIGAFPSENYIRVVWVGLEAHQIFELRKQASTHSITSQERNSYTPHITLLRVDDITPGKKKKLKKSMNSYRNTDITEFKVNKIKLFESRMTGSGTRYRELEVNHL